MAVSTPLVITDPAHQLPSGADDRSGEADLHERLDRSWGDPPGFWGWLTTTNHKRIALRGIVTAFIFFLAGGAEAAMMRAQLSSPENAWIGPDLYNQLFTVHGTT